MNAMPMPMMNGPMMPMNVPMPMGGPMGMMMPMSPMMGGMGMMMPMMSPMMGGMGMMMPMMCSMTCEMTKDGMTMKMMPTDASMMPRMKERCDAMQSMMAMGMPIMMMCGGMPMMMCTPTMK